LWLALICLTVEFVGLFSGLSLFLVRLSVFSIICHFAATLLICWYIIDTWFYSSFWYIWIFFMLIPACVEIVAFIRAFCCRVVEY
jgi:hypothetical protein